MGKTADFERISKEWFLEGPQAIPSGPLPSSALQEEAISYPGFGEPIVSEIFVANEKNGGQSCRLFPRRARSKGSHKEDLSNAQYGVQMTG
jgi:hypothetical protein